MKTLCETKFLNLKSTDVLGKDWFYAHRPNADNIAVILPVIEDKYVVFLKTRRPPLIAENIANFCIELPAGLVGDENINEDINEALFRELLEETGYFCRDFEILANKVCSSSGLTDEICTVARANIKQDKISRPPIDDNGVIVERIKVEIKNLKSQISIWQKVGYALSAQTLGALYLLNL